MDPAQVVAILRTLHSGLLHISEVEEEELDRAERVRAAAADVAAVLADQDGDSEPHGRAPRVGDSAETEYVVEEGDTAAAMGHPDQDVNVLGTPRLGLWFEMSTAPLLPEVGSGVRHVGVGLIVHHLKAVDVGESVRIRTRVVDVTGRAVVFTCEAHSGDRLVGLGTHHRILLETKD